MVIGWLIAFLPANAMALGGVEEFLSAAAPVSYLVLLPAAFCWLRIHARRPKELPSREAWYPLWFAITLAVLAAITVPLMLAWLALEQNGVDLAPVGDGAMVALVLAFTGFMLAAVLAMPYERRGPFGNAFLPVHVEGCGRVIAVVVFASLGFAGLGVADVARLT